MSFPWPDLLLASTGLHAGFQATVTLLVYPALAEVPPERWHDAHQRHSRRIVPLVGLVYVSLALRGRFEHREVPTDVRART